MPNSSDESKTTLDGSRTMSGKPSGFRSLVGYRAVTWREAYAEIELRLEGQHMNSLGIPHGGVYMTLLDAAFGHAVTWCPVPGNVRTCVTVSLNTSFLASARSGSLKAIGRLDGIEGRIATASGEVRDETGRLLAVGQASFLYAPGSERIEGVARKG